MVDTSADGARGADAPRASRAPGATPRLLTSASGRLSTRVDARAVAVSLVLLGVVFVGVAWSWRVGDFPIPLGDVVVTLLGGGSPEQQLHHPDAAPAPRPHRRARRRRVRRLRRRSSSAWSATRWPAPTSSASPPAPRVGAVFCIVMLDGTGLGVTGGALVGSVLTVDRHLPARHQAGRVQLPPGARRHRHHRRCSTAVTSYLLTTAEIYDAQRADGVAHRQPQRAGLGVRAAPGDRARRPACRSRWCSARHLRLLELGDDAAAGLGVPGARSRAALLLVGAALAAVATAAAGPVGVRGAGRPADRPPPGRRAHGRPRPRRARRCRCHGGADLSARRLFAPTELPVGVVTAVVGAPYLLWLLARANRIGRVDEMTRRPTSRPTDRAAGAPARSAPSSRPATCRWPTTTGSWSRTCRSTIPTGRITVIVGRQRLRQVDAAARPRPAAQPPARHRPARRRRDPPAADPGGGPAAGHPAPAADLPRRASRSPTSWPAAATRTSAGSASGRRTTSRGRAGAGRHRHDRPGRPLGRRAVGRAAPAGVDRHGARPGHRQLLLLDEPTTFLDLAHQVEVLDLLADLNEREGRTIVCVLHDLNLACRYAHHLVAMRDGAHRRRGQRRRGRHRGAGPRGVRAGGPGHHRPRAPAPPSRRRSPPAAVRRTAAGGRPGGGAAAQAAGGREVTR